MRAVVFMVSMIFGFVTSYPATVQHNYDNCLIITPERQKEIQYIKKQLSELLLKLDNQFEDLSINDVKLTISKYTDDEAHRNIRMEVNLNNCPKVKQISEENSDNFDEYIYPSAEELNNNEDILSYEFESDNKTDFDENIDSFSNESEDINDNSSNETNYQNETNYHKAEENLSNKSDSQDTESTDRSNYDSSNETYLNNDTIGEAQVDNSKVTNNSKEDVSVSNESVQGHQNAQTAVALLKSNADNQQKILKHAVTTETPKLKRRVELVIIQLNENEEKKVQEMEKKAGNKPFWLIEDTTGKREIQFL